MGRNSYCSKEGMKRGAWTTLEDNTLKSYIQLHGQGNWRHLPKLAGLKRCGKSCRLRWLNYLRPDIKRGNITGDEEDLIIRLHKLLGNRWSLIAGRLPGRTDNEIKNYWNTRINKKLKDNSRSNPNPKLSKSPSKQGLGPKIRHPTSGSESRAIRTKASRCTRTLYDQHVHVASTSFNQEQSHGDAAIDYSFVWKDPEPSDFLMDFDLDNKFLYDFLNTEIFDINSSYSSPNTDETLLLPIEMEPFSISSLDWPQYL